jgi:hypothetical protein
MTYTIISSDIDVIERAYYQFFDKFYDTSNKQAALEIIVDEQTHINPSWNLVQELHKNHNRLKIAYKLME